MPVATNPTMSSISRQDLQQVLQDLGLRARQVDDVTLESASGGMDWTASLDAPTDARMVHFSAELRVVDDPGAVVNSLNSLQLFARVYTVPPCDDAAYWSVIVAMSVAVDEVSTRHLQDRIEHWIAALDHAVDEVFTL